VGGGHELEDRFLALGERVLHVTPQERGEGLLVLPLGTMGGHRLHAVEGEQDLEVERLLRPERAVVVERGDALGGRHEVGRTRLRDALDERDDGLLRSRVVPRGERIRDGDGAAAQERNRCDREAEDRIHGYLAPPAPLWSFSSTWSREKLPGFCRGGNCWYVARCFATKACAGTRANACSTRQRS
jgi:hypothetical protein